ncbi:type I-E CRISPR-associated protein Cse2/CasB [Streptomyces sp. NPDC004647]|uniref:type I-E CRISPR-associated protein Cse2/CasB n=1 Tax=Streptomyces sp. NPDC004647 TaxID=3154671 RepID=UPI0033A1B553
MTSTPATAPPVGKAPGKAEQRPSEDFVARVLDLCQSKRVQAELGSGLGRPVERCNALHRYLVPRLPERMHPDAKRAHYAIAALIAARPRAAREADAAAAAETDGGEAAADWWRPNLGASLAMAVNKKIIKPDSAEGDLHLMARQSSDAIHPRLPALTGQLLRQGVPVDWAVLLEDLTWWNRDRDRIATRWLETYFRVRTLQDRRANPNEENE